MTQVEATQNMIAYSVVQDKPSLIALLKRNGVDMGSGASDREVTVAVLTASAKSQNFKKELAKLLTKNVKRANKEFENFVGDSSDFGFTGIDDFSFTGIDDFSFTGPTPQFTSNIAQSVKAAQVSPKSTAASRQASRVSATNPQGKTGLGLFFQNLGKSLTSEDTINAGLNVGLTAINNKVAGKQNTLQQEAVLITQKQDEVRQALAQSPSGSKTLTYVFVGVGILAIGAIIYIVAKKK